MAGTHDPLSASDALLWRIEQDPVLRSPIVVVGTFDRSPEWPRLEAALRRAVDAMPRLRQRIVQESGHPVWEDDPAFRLEHHLRRARPPAGTGPAGLLRVAEADATDAFEPTRSPWTFTVVDDDDGGAGFVLRFHHAISDGVGAMGLAQHVFDTSRRGGAGPGVDARPGASVPAAGGSPPGVLPAVAAAGSLLRAATDPLGSARRAARFGRSLARMLAAAPQPLSPAWRDRGLDRRLRVLEVPMADLRRAAAAAGGTVNDVFLGAVAGGARRYHDAVGRPVGALRFTVPINLRVEADDPGGNHFAPARFVVPIDDPDPVHRARLAGALVRGWRAEPALGATSALAGVLDRLPTALLVRLFAGMLRGVDVDAVDVPGLARPAYFGGARVERLWAFAPPTGAAVSTTLVSHGPWACIGVAADNAAIADPDLLTSSIGRALDEALAARPPARHRERVAS